MSRPKPPVRRHFYPRPPRGGRPSIFAKYFRYEPFLSTPSARRATGFASRVSESYAFLSTPSARRATTAQLHQSLHQAISIHALREEGDHRPVRFRDCPQNFYPRPPRGGRHALLGVVFIKLVFLSTPSARRATCLRPVQSSLLHISIHALREEGDQSTTSLLPAARMYFYPRPPRGGRPVLTLIITDIWLFLSTPSARRATAKTETKSLFSNKLYNILHEFRRALIYNGSKNYPNHAK